jgi:hypothetical protein
MGQIKRDIDEMAGYGCHHKAFLADGDVLILPTEPSSRLCNNLKKCKTVERIAV